MHTDPVGKAIARTPTTQYNVIGVVEDFHYASAKLRIAPLMIVLGRNSGSILVKIKTADIPSLLSDMKKQWDALKPAARFSYNFLDEGFARLYAT